MGKKITEIKDFPKDLLDQKKLRLYKAFVIKDPDEKMNLNQNIEMMFTDCLSALWYFLDDYTLEDLDEFQTRVDSGEPVMVSFVTLALDTKDLKKKDLVDEGELYYDVKTGKIAITLADKKFDVSVEDQRLVSLSYTIDKKTEQRHYEGKLLLEKGGFKMRTF